MRIGINTRLYLPGKLDGIGKFTAEVARRLAALAPQHEFHWFFDRKVRLPQTPPSNVFTHVLPPPTRHPFLYYLWFEKVLPRALKKHRIDRLFSPDGFLSLRSSVPAYPVIHDLNFEEYPKDLPFWTRRFYRHYFPRYARKAERIMTVSRYSATDISERYGVDASRIDVVYNGVDDRFHPIPEEEQKKVRDRWTEGEPYLIHVGALHPRKNIARMIRAFDEWSEGLERPVKLMLVGERMWWSSEMEQAVRNVHDPDKLVFAGHVNDERLNALLGSSEALLYLSYFEGFGIPVLEAMKAAIPVLCADRTSLPEVGGDAVRYCDPFSESSIREGMDDCFQEEALRSRLIQKGVERADRFTWDHVAEKVLKTLETEGS